MQSASLVENRHIAVKRCRHGLFMFNRHDTFVGRGLDLYGEWCDFEIQMLTQFINPGDTVVDAGANIGTHTVALGNKVGPTGTVHAFEPQPRLFAMLAGNVALNALDWVACHQKAVGEAIGTIEAPPLPSPETSCNFSAISLVQDPSPSQGDKPVKVPLVTLDSLDLESCAAIKIDVEGMESKVLAGAHDLIKRCQPALYIEANSSECTNPMIEFFREWDYDAYWSIYPYYAADNYFSNADNVWATTVWSSNLICVPSVRSKNMKTLPKFLGEDDNWRKGLERIHQATQPEPSPDRS